MTKNTSFKIYFLKTVIKNIKHILTKSRLAIPTSYAFILKKKKTILHFIKVYSVKKHILFYFID
jgi:hypothetical protein